MITNSRPTLDLTQTQQNDFHGIKTRSDFNKIIFINPSQINFNMESMRNPK